MAWAMQPARGLWRHRSADVATRRQLMEDPKSTLVITGVTSNPLRRVFCCLQSGKIHRAQLSPKRAGLFATQCFCFCNANWDWVISVGCASPFALALRVLKTSLVLCVSMIARYAHNVPLGWLDVNFLWTFRNAQL